MGLLIGAAMMPGAALATGISINHERLPAGTPMAACLQRAALAIASVGMRPLNTTPSAAWGERDGGRVYTIYCMPANDVVAVVGAGNTSAEVSPDVTALATAFRSGGAPRAAGK